tara:strand:+ start:1446 stop:2276 length:831 start_codon:yes stop_codon:yes gene_type:complete
MFHVDILQACSSESLEENKLWVEQQFNALPEQDEHPRIAVLPECVLLFGREKQQQLEIAESPYQGQIQQWLGELAQKHKTHIIAGTLPIQADSQNIWNRTLVYNDQGTIIGHYDKIHLFDADLGTKSDYYVESKTYQAGNQTQVFDLGFIKIGIAICYDLRFPELFQQLRLKGAELIAVPAAFTEVTGKPHWQVLLQARAIETQCFIAASAQYGAHQNNRKTWGNSMLIDPWGEIIGQKTGLGWLSSPLSLTRLHQIRKSMPIAHHRRFEQPQIKS